MPAKHVGNLGAADIAMAASYVRRVFHERGVPIAATSCLGVALHHADQFANGTFVFPHAITGSQRDEIKMAIAEQVLKVFRLSESLEILISDSTPGIKERLMDLASGTSGNKEHDHQYWDADYETFAASDFTASGAHVTFMSRWQERAGKTRHVEFKVKHKWPVECKRARGEAGGLRNLKRAAEKFEEHWVAGLACLAFDGLVLKEQEFGEFESVESFDRLVSETLQMWWQENQQSVLEVIRAVPIQAVIIHVTKPIYTHGSAEAGLPTIREGFTRSGEWIRQAVINRCLEVLENPEVPAKPSDSSNEK